jgi:hypothetical protein
MNTPVVRISERHAESKPMAFIYVARQYTGVDLYTAKAFLDRLRSGEVVDLAQPDEIHARKLGEDLLRLGVVARVELILADGGPAIGVIAPPAPVPRPVFFCPSCGTTLANSTDCPSCDWLRFPGDRSRWQTQGPCPRCGFGYRWDGVRCSHCGFGAVEQPPVART